MKTEDVKTITKKEKKAGACEKKIQSMVELDSDVRNAWILANGENPFGGDAEDLLIRQNRYGAKKVADAIEECRRSRNFGDRISMNFLDAKLLRGGKRSAGTSTGKTSTDDAGYSDFYGEQLEKVGNRKQPFDD